MNPGGEELIKPEVVKSTVDVDRALTLPIQRERNAIFVDVELHGKDGKKAARKYLFDTGASFTTITSETAKELGIEVPEDAPTVEFNTASGVRVSRVVYLPALSIGGSTERMRDTVGAWGDIGVDHIVVDITAPGGPAGRLDALRHFMAEVVGG